MKKGHKLYNSLNLQYAIYNRRKCRIEQATLIAADTSDMNILFN